MIIKLKGVALVLLILSLTLPISRVRGCDLSKMRQTQEYHYNYAFSNFQVDKTADWITVVVYLWHIVFFIYLIKAKSLKKWFHLLEILLSFASGLWIYARTSWFSEIWIGAWVAISVFTFYLSLSVASVRARLTSRSKRT